MLMTQDLVGGGLPGHQTRAGGCWRTLSLTPHCPTPASPQPHNPLLRLQKRPGRRTRDNRTDITHYPLHPSVVDNIYLLDIYTSSLSTAGLGHVSGCGSSDAGLKQCSLFSIIASAQHITSSTADYTNYLLSTIYYLASKPLHITMDI